MEAEGHDRANMLLPASQYQLLNDALNYGNAVNLEDFALRGYSFYLLIFLLRFIFFLFLIVFFF